MQIEISSLIPREGFLRSWLDYCGSLEFPDSYGLFALLSVCSAAVQRRIEVNPGTEPHAFTNLYVVLYGPSGARKGTALRHALGLLAEAFGNSVRVLPRRFTFERLLSVLSAQSEEEGTCHGLIASDEFAELIGGPEYQLSNLGFLKELWDCYSISRDTHAHGYEELIDPYIAMCACVTPKGLGEINPNIMDTGGLRRMLIIPEYRMREMSAQPPINTALLEALAEVLRRRLGPSAFSITGMKLTPEAEEWMSHWYLNDVKHYLDIANERESHFVSCMQAHALKLASNIALLEGSKPDTLSKEHFILGAQLVERVMKPMFKVYAGLVPTGYARLRFAVVQAIEAAGGSLPGIILTKNIVNATGTEPEKVKAVLAQLFADNTLDGGDGNVYFK